MLISQSWYDPDEKSFIKTDKEKEKAVMTAGSRQADQPPHYIIFPVPRLVVHGAFRRRLKAVRPQGEWRGRLHFAGHQGDRPCQLHRRRRVVWWHDAFHVQGKDLETFCLLSSKLESCNMQTTQTNRMPCHSSIEAFVPWFLP